MAAKGDPCRNRPPVRSRYSLRLRLDSDEYAIRHGLEQIKAHAARHGADHAAQSTIEIVLAEVLNNIAEHAYATRPGGGPIDITCTAAPDAFRYTVLDQGTPLPPEVLRARSIPKQYHPDAPLPEGGFGWPLIKMLSGSLKFTRKHGRNCLRFTVPITRGTMCPKDGK